MTSHKQYTDDMSDKLLEFIADAAAQDDFLELDEIDTQDKYFQKIYACDSNVIDLFIDPFSHNKSIVAPGEIFRSDTSKKKAAIAAAIGQFIWYKLGTKYPIFLIPPVDHEINVLLHIAARNIKLPDTVIRELKNQVPALESNISEDAEKAARDIAEIIIGVTKRKRLFALKNGKRFLSIDDIPQSGIDLPKEVMQVVAPMRRIADMIEFSENRTRWQRCLMGLGRKPDIRLERDMDAMARLEMWNRRLMRLPQPYRMIYITSDNSLLEAGASVHKFGMPNEQVEQVFPENPSFREVFLRHPRCFLDRPYTLRPNLGDSDRFQTTQSIRSWLSLLLGEYQNGQSKIGEWDWGKGSFVLTGEAESDIRSISDKNPRLLEEIKAAWSEFTDAVELTSLHSGKLFDIGDADSRLKIDLLRGFLKDHIHDFEADLKETWEVCVRVFTEVRFLIGIVHNQGELMWQAPRLCLEDDASNRFLGAAHEWLKNKENFTIEAFETEKEKLNQADPSKYNFLIIVAYLLAQSQNWPSAAFLCAHAREIAKKETDEHKKVKLEGSNGREAAYLEAFARRHVARSASDLQELSKLIDEAEEICKKESQVYKKNGKSLDVVTERFDAERLALEYSHLMLAWHEGATIGDAQLEPVARKYLGFAKKLSTQISDSQRSDNRAHSLLKSLCQRAYTNICALALLAGEKSHLVDIGEDAVNQLQKNIEDLQENELSLFVKIVRDSGLAMFGDSATRIQKCQDALKLIEDALQPGRDEQGLVYDRRRYLQYKKILQKRLEASE